MCAESHMPKHSAVAVCVQLFSRSVISDSVTPWTAAHQASLSFTISWSLLKFMSIELVMPSNHLVLCRPLLLLPSIFPSIRVSYWTPWTVWKTLSGLIQICWEELNCVKILHSEICTWCDCPQESQIQWCSMHWFRSIYAYKKHREREKKERKEKRKKKRKRNIENRYEIWFCSQIQFLTSFEVYCL